MQGKICLLYDLNRSLRSPGDGLGAESAPLGMLLTLPGHLLGKNRLAGANLTPNGSDLECGVPTLAGHSWSKGVFACTRGVLTEVVWLFGWCLEGSLLGTCEVCPRALPVRSVSVGSVESSLGLNVAQEGRMPPSMRPSFSPS